MKNLKPFIDKRLTGSCIYCGGQPSTSDHVPSKILLDEPYPSNLQIVSACTDCNESFSLDEQYFACMVECIIAGSTDPEKISREKIKATLQKQEALRKKIARQCSFDLEGNTVWAIDVDRIKNTLHKLARGHAYYELGLPWLGNPEQIEFMPLDLMTIDQQSQFESLPDITFLPELGSRAFQRLFGNSSDLWQIVQSNRYRYHVSQSDYVVVRMIFSEYLAAEVTWSGA